MSSSNAHLWTGGRSKHYGEFIMCLQDEHFNCRAVAQKLPDLLTALKSMGANDAKLTDIGKRIIDKVQKNFDIYDTVMTKYGINDIKIEDQYQSSKTSDIKVEDQYRFFQVESLLDYLYYDFPNEMQELNAECKIDMLAAMIKPLYKIDNPDGKTKAGDLVNHLESLLIQLEKCSTILSQWFNKIYQQIHQKMKDICSNSVCNFNGKELKSLSDILIKIDLFMNDMLKDVELENKIYADIMVHFDVNNAKCNYRQNVVELIEEDGHLLRQFVNILHSLISINFDVSPYDKLFQNQLSEPVDFANEAQKRLENIQSSDLKSTDNKSSEVKQICSQKDVAIPTFVTTLEETKNISNSSTSSVKSGSCCERSLASPISLIIKNSQCYNQSSTLSAGSTIISSSFASSECSLNSTMSTSLLSSNICNTRRCEQIPIIADSFS